MATATAQPQQGMSIGVGGLRFNVRYSKTANDRGPSLRIYGDVDDKPVQLLRFDCFDQTPHFHYDPDGKNNQLRMDKTKVSDPISWSMDYMRGNITSLVRVAGYGALANQLDEGVLCAALPTVEKALRDSIPTEMAGLEASGLRFAVDYRSYGARSWAIAASPRRRGRQGGAALALRLLRGRATLPLRPPGQEQPHFPEQSAGNGPDRLDDRVSGGELCLPGAHRWVWPPSR